MAIKIVKKIVEALSPSPAPEQVAQQPAVAPAVQPEEPKAPTPPPLEVKPAQQAPKPLGVVEGQTIMQAVAEFANRGPKDKRTLMIVRKDNTMSYKVIGYDEKTKRTRMVSSNNIDINPLIGERENEQYYPMWR